MRVTKLLFLALALGIALVVGFVFQGPFISTAWHVQHGRNVTFQGHELELPLMWRVRRIDGSHVLFSRALLLGSITHNLRIERPARIDVLGRPVRAGYMRKSLKINAARTQFSCFIDEAQAATDASELVCVNEPLDWTAIFRGNADELNEARAILASTN